MRVAIAREPALARTRATVQATPRGRRFSEAELRLVAQRLGRPPYLHRRRASEGSV